MRSQRSRAARTSMPSVRAWVGGWRLWKSVSAKHSAFYAIEERRFKWSLYVHVYFVSFWCSACSALSCSYLECKLQALLKSPSHLVNAETLMVWMLGRLDVQMFLVSSMPATHPRRRFSTHLSIPAIQPGARTLVFVLFVTVCGLCISRTDLQCFLWKYPSWWSLTLKASYFGEYGVLFNQPREATARCEDGHHKIKKSFFQNWGGGEYRRGRESNGNLSTVIALYNSHVVQARGSCIVVPKTEIERLRTMQCSMLQIAATCVAS